MAKQIRAVALAVTLLALAAGCAESSRQQATGKGSVRGINAIATAPSINFLIEERSIDQVSFRESTGFRDYDDLDYTFSFDLLPFAGVAGRRLASQYIDFVAGTEYTLVLTGSVANPSVMLWEAPERDFADGDTVFEIDFVHLAPLLGEVDVYFVESGEAPVSGMEVGKLQSGERVPYAEFQAAAYQVVVTPPGDDSTELFRSSELNATGGVRNSVVLFDTDPTVTAPVSVALIGAGGNSVALPDVDSPAQLRLMHASFATENVDVYLGEAPGELTFQNVGFGELSPFEDFDEASKPVVVTAAGDPDTTLLEGTATVASNSRSTLLLIGTANVLTFTTLRDDGRPVATFPTIRIVNAAVSQPAVDVYLLEPGTPIDGEVLPSTFFLSPPFDTGYFPVTSGELELTVTEAGQLTTLSEPVLLDLANGDVVDLAILDTAEADVLEVRVIDSKSL